MADARFAKPLDTRLIRDLALNHEVLVTVEEGSVGGFGSYVLQFLSDEGLLDRGLRVRTKVLPDVFIDHGKPVESVGAAEHDLRALQHGERLGGERRGRVEAEADHREGRQRRGLGGCLGGLQRLGPGGDGFG